MEQRWKEILGQLQPMAPGTVDVFVTDSMGVLVTKQPMDFNEVEHIHRGYEFIIPFGQSTPYKVQNKTVETKHNKIFPVNPEQPHIAVKETSANTLIALFLEVEFLNDLAKSVSNISELAFENIGFTYDVHLQNLLTDFINELTYKQCGHDLITQSIALQVGVHLLRNLKNNCRLPIKERNYAEKKPIARAVDFIHANYQTPLSLNELAKAANLSPYHFCRVFKAETGKTPSEYLLDIKLKQAKELLLKCRDKSITEICFESGFNNLSHFSRTFLKKVDITPTDFVRQLL